MSGFAFDDLASLIHLLNKLNTALKQIQIAQPDDDTN
jgi:hypothetical protein